VALPSDAVGGGSASLRCNRRGVVIIECGLASQFTCELVSAQGRWYDLRQSDQNHVNKKGETRSLSARGVITHYETLIIDRSSAA